MTSKQTPGGSDGVNEMCGEGFGVWRDSEETRVGCGGGSG